MIVVCTIFVILHCMKILMPSDDVSYARCIAWNPGKWFFLNSKILTGVGAQYTEFVVYYSNIQQWMMTNGSILAALCCFEMKHGFFPRFVHVMVGARSSAFPPEQIGLKKLWRKFF